MGKLLSRIIDENGEIRNERQHDLCSIKSVIIQKFPMGKITVEQMSHVHKMLESKVGDDIAVVTLPDTFTYEVVNLSDES